MTEALKPCPFCGSEAKITDTEPYAAECTNIFCLIDGPCHGSKADAIEAWNLRSPSVIGSDTAGPAGGMYGEYTPISVGSDTARLPSDRAGLDDAARALVAEYRSIWPHAGFPALREAKMLVRAAIAALSRAPEAVTVKPLEWSFHQGIGRGSSDIWRSQSSAGDYAIELTSAGFEWFRYAVRLGVSTELPEAKSAAQADYENRVLAALATPPAPQPVGLVLVPEEPTDDMIDAWMGACGPMDARRCYRSMLAVRPVINQNT